MMFIKINGQFSIRLQEKHVFCKTRTKLRNIKKAFVKPIISLIYRNVNQKGKGVLFPYQKS
jgi:hypothetical protein